MPASSWITRVRAAMQDIPQSGGSDDFFRHHYQANIPTVIDLPSWPAFRWTLDDIQDRVGYHTPVEVQTNRRDDPDYEMRSHAHKSVVPFEWFVDAVQSGPGNDVYMTAQNRSVNSVALEGLWKDVGPLPEFLRPQPEVGFVWLGNDTLTPLHHDETNNLMCQVLGTKHIRMFPPDDRDRLDPSVGVHSALGWVTDEMVADRSLNVTDVWINPGQALFLPIGWWHCVRSFGLALTIVYTSFIWLNFWGRATD